MRVNSFLFLSIGLIFGLTACTGSDGYRTAPESQIYAIQEVDDIPRGQQVQITKQASETESEVEYLTEEEIEEMESSRSEQVVMNQEAASTTVEEEIETIEVTHEAGAEEEQVIEQVKQASQVERVKKKKEKPSDGYEEMEFINEDVGVEATIVQPAALISSQVVEVLEDEALMAGEETCPDDEHMVEVTKNSKTTIMTSKGFPVVQQGFYYFERDCNMREAPGRQSYVYDVINAGRKLWVEEHNSEWAKVFRSSGPAFVHKGCLSLN